MSPNRSPLVLRILRSVFLVACCFSLAFLTPNLAGASPVLARVKMVSHRLGRMSNTERMLFKRWTRHFLLAQWFDAIAAHEEAERLACGGDLPPCYVAQRESKFNPYAVNPGHMGAPYGDPGDPYPPNGHASGKWQFMPGTWNNYDGYPYAAAAPPSVQNDKAREVWAGGAGASNWACC